MYRSCLGTVSTLTAHDLFELTRGKIASKIQDANNSQVLHSPDWVTLLVWNVIVSFAVNVCSNAAYAILKERLQQKGKITSEDLRNNRQMIETVTIEVNAHRSKHVVTEISLLLQRSGVVQTPNDLALWISETLHEVLNRNAE
jgi:hypothetical protein